KRLEKPFMVVLLGIFSASCGAVEAGAPLQFPAPSRERAPLEVGTKQAKALDSKDRVPARDNGPIEVGIHEAIFLALDNNRSLRVERLSPAIRKTFEDEEQAVFDPLLKGELDFSRDRGVERARASGGFVENTGNLGSAGLGLSQYFTTGTSVGVDLSEERTWSDLYSDQYATRAGMTVTQALLRGAGTGVNLASLYQARLDTEISEYEFRGFAEALIAQVEQTYWDYALAHSQIRIFEESLSLAEQQLREIEEMIAVGRLAETEVTAVQAEIASQRQGLIAARSTMETTRLRLIRLLNPQGKNRWERDVLLKDRPSVPDVKLDSVQAHVDVALRFRPDLNQARLGVERGDLEIIKTRNGLLPKLDLFVTLGKSGYADSFGSSVGDVKEDSYDFTVGLKVQYPLRNRGAEARHSRAVLRRDQVSQAIDNLAQLVELDVRSSYIEVNRAREQISATTATRRLQEEKLRIETEKLRVGRSTVFLVSQAQRDLLSSQIVEVRAAVSYLKSLVDLYRLEGSLLERRGIRIPGGEPSGLSGR
ncbi:MAG: TolC family protein, partial [Proteobacteria bacterium]|nr:TolC family protein [Pseudomonadota bacterium]